MFTLKASRIVGFFSLPSPSLAEHNPTAYQIAISEAPAGAGTCAHCGMGILHHVVIEDENGKRHFIGTTCAEKVGCDPEQIKHRWTDEDKAAWEARRLERQAAYDEKRAAYEEEVRIRRALRLEQVGDIVHLLESLGGEFYTSLASQLRDGPLSPRQAHYVAKATSETGRRNKRNADAWDDILDRCVEEDEEEDK